MPNFKAHIPCEKCSEKFTNIHEWTMQQYVIYRRHQDSQYLA